MASQKAQKAGEDPGGGHEPQRALESLRQNLGDGHPVEEGRPQIPVEDIGEPAQVPLQGRVVDPPVVFQLGDLLLAHSTQGGLAHVGLERVQGGGRHEKKGRQAHPQQEQYHAQELFAGETQTVGHGRRPPFNQGG